MDPVPLEEHVASSSSVLLLAPARSPSDDHGCIDLLTPLDPTRENVLSVTFSEPPDQRLAVWQRHAGETLPMRGVIATTVESEAPSAVEDLPSLSVELLREPLRPADVGLAVGQYLGRWDSTPEPTLACFHSLTQLIERMGLEDTVDLVKSLNARFEDRDVGAHYHLDPTTLPEDTVTQLRPLFDAVVERSDDGGWVVTTVAADEERPLFVSKGQTASMDSGSGPTDGAMSLANSFDTVIDVLASPRRRTLLYYLAAHPGETLPLETVVDVVLDRERNADDPSDAATRRAVEVSLYHIHLPKLDALGIVDLSVTDGTVRYYENPALEGCIEHARTLEGR